MRISDWSSGVCSSDLEYGRIGFQGGLQYYRVVTGGHLAREMKTFAGRAIEVPSLFIAGSSDWGTHQKPGEFEAMQARGLKDLRGVHLIDGAGHWVEPEQAEAGAGLLVECLGGARGRLSLGCASWRGGGGRAE